MTPEVSEGNPSVWRYPDIKKVRCPRNEVEKSYVQQLTKLRS